MRQMRYPYIPRQRGGRTAGIAILHFFSQIQQPFFAGFLGPKLQEVHICHITAQLCNGSKHDSPEAENAAEM